MFSRDEICGMSTERSRFDDHDAFEPAEDGKEYALTTVAFPVRAVPDRETTVTVRVPTLAAATADEIGEVVAEDWERTLGRRLEDAPGALPARPDLEAFSVTRGGDHLEVTYRLSPGGPEIAKAIAEYVEGTYVETTIPGYEYEPPVADLLASARMTGRDEPDARSGEEDGTVQSR